MKDFIFVCDNCEDIERTNSNLTGYHCDCGGHFYLKKSNNFERKLKNHICDNCNNKNTDKCLTCIHNN